MNKTIEILKTTVGRKNIMKGKFVNILSAGILILLLSQSIAFAGGRARAGTSAGAQLLIPVGVRGIAIGGSNVANIGGIEAMFWNPAGMAVNNNKTTALFSRMSYIADMDLSYGAIMTNLAGVGTFGFSLKSLNVGDIAVTTENNPDGTGEIESPSFFILGVSFARNLSDRVSVGLNTKVINETFANVGATGFAVDIGVQYSGLGGVEGLTLGVVMKNFGTPMSYSGSGLLTRAEADDFTRPSSLFGIQTQSDELPSTLELGTSYTLRSGENNTLNLSATFVNDNFQSDFGRIGAEYVMNDMISLRGGFQTNISEIDVESGDSNKDIFGLTLGAGLEIESGGLDLTLGYAFRDVDVFDANHVFSLEIGF